ncbi:MAG TPA: hypothetical protein DD723_03225 [Candidatus Omnitrophica bacterium]|nr:MAG: hypothetical protein A2Z81_01050 [Omnitrophica WOR_2 bacterium GWA2_45_18]HBR14541.1 hypothetical protein [Candidatus Omnitrophota bacterium]
MRVHPLRKCFAGRNKGSLLLEGLLSVAILSFAVTLIIQAMTSSLRAILYSADYTTALVLGEDKMFDLLKDGFIESGLRQEGKFSSPYNRFQYALKADPHQEDGENGFNDVTLDVFWGKEKRKNHVVVRTYFLTPPE